MTVDQIRQKTQIYIQRTKALGEDTLINDIFSFLVEIAAADGQLDRNELQFIMAITGRSDRRNIINDVKNAIASRDIVTMAVPFVFSKVVDTENDPKASLGNLPTSNELLMLYELIGLNFMASDGETAKTEVEKYTAFMNRLKKYRTDAASGAASNTEPFSFDPEEFFNSQTGGTASRPQSAGSTRQTAQSNLDQYAQKWAPAKNLSEEIDPYVMLDSMIGMNNIKLEVGKLINFAKIQQLRMDQGLPPLPVSLHMVFTGNPGTGKTTVARIIGAMYAKMGLLSSGHLVEAARVDLVSPAVGQTAEKTQKKIDEAQGGVLFIDEAYTLAKDGVDYGVEAIETLLKEMEDKRDNFIVIAAGYSDPMAKFIYSNQGLKSRFNRFISFEDYNGKELYQIFEKMCRENKIAIDKTAAPKLTKHFNRIYRNRDKNFANGRDVRNYFENTVMSQSQRLASIPRAGAKELSVFTSQDLGLNDDPMDESLETLLEQLDNLPGLSRVKTELTAIINHVRMQQERIEAGLDSHKGTLHMVFSGNPGTGKTTVARLLAKILAAISVLSEGQLVETDRGGLVAGYVGQTAIKTQDAINAALGGVLFIDEAYALTTDYSANDFGQEAVDTLVKGMEDNRSNLVVIVAGYEDKMKEFVKSNPGLKSRFTRYIHFDDYSQEELMQIFELMCDEKQYVMEPKFRAVLGAYFAKYPATRIGNGRGVRNLFEKVVIFQENRLIKMDPAERTRESMQLLKAEDLLHAFQDLSAS